ncbi:MAG: LPS export ABC transporter permease LptF [Casimicrobiaceae bacterium]|nr:LPS export ABC transporter permease LptF [Casimicrobiaceae bacterium]MCX8097820.1 LPS export ABC transporter permease LptF [Casimicrobiaceae bacterium]MDW8311390.1 LPS export ABC transporter permease LptF [Burkholderiales bacterium]
MIFRRALLRELTVTAIYVFLVLVAIVVTQFLVRLIGAASTGALPSEGLAPLVGLRLIAQLPPLIVIALFISVLLTLSRAWRDSEMVIWMVSGQSLTTWIRPVLLFSLPLLMLATVLSTYLSPWAERRSIEFRRMLEARDELSALAPGIFQEMRRSKQVYFIERVDLLDGRIRDVFVFAEAPDGLWVTRAEQGAIVTSSDGERYVVLHNGQRVRLLHAPDGKTVQWEYARFDRYGIRLSSNEVADSPLSERARDTLSLLRDGRPTALAWVFYRVSIPLAGLSLVILAVPLAYVNPRLGRSINLIIAVLLLMTALNFITILQTQIERERIGLVAALLLFHGTLAALALGLFYRRFRGAVFGVRRRQKTFAEASG